jgi:hypothetical protein
MDRAGAVTEMRKVSEAFLGGTVGLVAFFERMTLLLGRFDPLDETTADLPPAMQDEVVFYSRWTGGEFGETDNLIPKRRDWQYGVDLERYGWVDEVSYREAFGRAYRNQFGWRSPA